MKIIYISLSYYHNLHVVGTVHCDENPLEGNEEVSKQTEITVDLVPNDVEGKLTEIPRHSATARIDSGIQRKRRKMAQSPSLMALDLQKEEHRLRMEQLRQKIDQAKKEHLLKMEILHMIKGNLYDSSTNREDKQAHSVLAISQLLSPF